MVTKTVSLLLTIYGVNKAIFHQFLGGLKKNLPKKLDTLDTKTFALSK